MTEQRLKIALTKGRVEKQVLPLLEQAGVDCSQVRNKQRRLIFDSETLNLTNLFWLRGQT